MTIQEPTEKMIEPCPFAHEVKRGVYVDVDRVEFGVVAVACSDCGAAGPYVDILDLDDGPSDAERAAAIKAWNGRLAMQSSSLLISPDSGADPALAVPAKPASGLDASRCDQGERLTLERIANWSDVECDFETIDLFELRAVVREYLDELRSLSSQLGAGLADNVTDPMKLVARIQWGVDHIQSVEAQRAADLIGELSKKPQTTWGQVRTAVLKRGEA